jgi:putative N6-adenine-specific DNA methylase
MKISVQPEMHGNKNMKFTAKTLYGLEKVLAAELTGLGVSGVETGNRAVFFQGDLPLLYASNYMLRTAVTILWQIAEFNIKSADQLYNKAMNIEWDRFMDVDRSFSVVPVVQSPFFNHTGFAALKLKDAVADYFRKKTGRRPSVDTDDPAVMINLHISNDRVTISLDSSHEPLFKRGYRKLPGEAPLNEILAAGMLLLAGWDGSTSLTDPMCGSGTIPIEAALIACKIPPGKFRRFYGFQNWKNYDKELFGSVRSQFDNLIIESPAAEISGSDISGKAIEEAIVNCENAGLTGLISFSQCDIREFSPPPGKGGYIIMNPPYGERISAGDTDELYGTIGNILKHKCHGYTAWLISPNRESMKFIGLKPSARHILFNGALECIYSRYEMYEGSKKQGKSKII